MRLTIIAFFALLFGMNTAIADGHDKANAFGFALNVPAENIAEVEAVLASHMKFMQSTHSVTGDASTRLNSYSVIKGPVLVDPTDPSKGTTGGMMYILSEHYETPAGFAKHMKASTGWSDLPKMQEMMMKFGVGAVYPGFHMQSMNR